MAEQKNNSSTPPHIENALMRLSEIVEQQDFAIVERSLSTAARQADDAADHLTDGQLTEWRRRFRKLAATIRAEQDSFREFVIAQRNKERCKEEHHEEGE